eukprot:1853089-Rhodomonas_salina.2
MFSEGVVEKKERLDEASAASTGQDTAPVCVLGEVAVTLLLCFKGLTYGHLLNPRRRHTFLREVTQMLKWRAASCMGMWKHRSTEAWSIVTSCRTAPSWAEGEEVGGDEEKVLFCRGYSMTMDWRGASVEVILRTGVGWYGGGEGGSVGKLLDVVSLGQQVRDVVLCKHSC